MTGTDISKMLRRAAGLLAACAVIAAVAIALFTDIGSHTLFRIGVRLNAHEVDITDRAHLEYYDAKQSLGDYSDYRIFIDGNDSASWDAVLDFLKFIKQNRELNAVVADGIDAALANEFLASGDFELISGGTVSAVHEKFLTALYSYNTLQPPQKRVYIAEADTSECSYIIDCREYTREYAVDGVMDVSVIYPDSENCDELFDVPSLGADGTRIRFGTLEALEGYTYVLEALSGNFGAPEFEGLDQPSFYFLIESGAAE